MYIFICMYVHTYRYIYIFIVTVAMPADAHMNAFIPSKQNKVQELKLKLLLHKNSIRFEVKVRHFSFHVCTPRRSSSDDVCLVHSIAVHVVVGLHETRQVNRVQLDSDTAPTNKICRRASSDNAHERDLVTKRYVCMRSEVSLECQ